MSGELEALRDEIRILRAERDAAEAARRRLAFLGEASRLLASSLDYATTLESVARLAVPEIADACVVLLAREPGVGPLEVAYGHARDVELGRRALLAYLSGSGRDVLERVLRTGQSYLNARVDDARLRELAIDPEALEVLRAVAPTSALAVPLVASDRVLGVLALARMRPDREYGADDLKLAEELACRAAIAVENALLHTAERRARAAAVRAADRTERLQRVTQALSEALTPAEVAETVIVQAMAAFGAATGVVVCRDAPDEPLSVLACRGLGTEVLAQFGTIPLGTPSMLNDVAASGRALYLSASARAERYPETFARDPNSRSLGGAAVPLVVHGRLLGVMALGFADGNELPKQDRAYLEVMARHCAQALERARLFEAAQTERARFEAVLQQMPAGVAILEAPSGRLILANAQLEQIMRGELAGAEPLKEFPACQGFHADGRVRAPNEWPSMRAITQGEIMTDEVMDIARADGTRGAVRMSAAPIRDRAGRIVAGVATFYDVTEQRKAERALRASEERHRLVALATNDVLWDLDFARDTVEFSEAIERVYLHDRAGIPREARKAYAWWLALVHPDDRERVDSSVRTMSKTSGESWSLDYRFRRGDGSYAWVFMRACLVRDAGRLVRAIGSMMDMTARRRAAEEGARLAALVHSSHVAIIGADARGVIESWNGGAARLFGYAPDEVLGRHMASLSPPERANEAQELLDRCARGERVACETVWRRSDGQNVEVAVALSPVRGVAGELAGYAAIVHDVTERNRLRMRLAMADRMASLGTLAAGVAHEINNPLAYVSANLQVIESGLRHLAREDLSSAGRELLASLAQAAADALDGATRVSHIVRDLRTLSRADEDVRSLVNLCAVLDVATKIAASEARHRARIVKEYDEVPAVMGNEARLVQVFINLMVNAAQSISEGAVERNEIRVVTRTDPDGRAVVEIRDTGSGIAPEALPRIFEPFFTTKPSEGTGMGLSICHGIVTAHGGEISVESVMGRGSVFRVVLPPAPAGIAPMRSKNTAPLAPMRRGRVLIVDDEVRLGRVLERELSEEHEVLFVPSGREALGHFLAGARFDLILCDLMMPALTGMDLYGELKRFAPDQARRMVFLTGGAFTPAARRFLEEVDNPRLEKPFDLETFHAVVREALR